MDHPWIVSKIVRTQYVCKYGVKAMEELIGHLKDTCKDPAQEKKIRALQDLWTRCRADADSELLSM